MLTHVASEDDWNGGKVQINTIGKFSAYVL